MRRQESLCYRWIWHDWQACVLFAQAAIERLDGARIDARARPIPVLMLVMAIGFMRPVSRLNTTAQAGDILAEMALGEIDPPCGRIYASLVKRRLTQNLLIWPVGMI